MRDARNIAEIAELRPDYMGFIFYKRSPRFAGGMEPDALSSLHKDTKRVGVFVDAAHDYILETAERFSLDFIQLHGDETTLQCSELRKKYKVIKAFGIGSVEDLTKVYEYEGTCDHYLFDTKTPLKGGSGTAFDHSLLTHYKGATPYFISGGIGPEDAEYAAGISIGLCMGVDINSRFETSLGIKDVKVVERFMNTIRELK